jgi:hypothetical protein
VVAIRSVTALVSAWAAPVPGAATGRRGNLPRRRGDVQDVRRLLRRVPAPPLWALVWLLVCVLIAVVVMAAVVVVPTLRAGRLDGPGPAGRVTVVPAPEGPATSDPPEVAAMKDREERRERQARRTVEHGLRNRLDPGADLDRVDPPARQACRGLARLTAAGLPDPPARGAPAPEALGEVARTAGSSGHGLVSGGGQTLAVVLRHFARDGELVVDAALALAQGCAKAGLGPTGPGGAGSVRTDAAALAVCRRVGSGRPAGLAGVRRLWSKSRYSMVPELMPAVQAVRAAAEAGRPTGPPWERLARLCRP